MKILYLSLLCFISSASSAFHDELDQTSNELVHDFMVGMNNIPSLKDVLHLEHKEEAEQLDKDVKAELGKTFKRVLQELLGKIRHVIERSKEMSIKIVEKAKEIVDDLKGSGTPGEKVIEKIKLWIKMLQEKLHIGKRNFSDLIENSLKELEISNLLQNLKEKLLNRVNVQAIIEYIKFIFGESSTIGKALIMALRTQGQQALKTFINDLVLKGVTNSNKEERSVSNIPEVLCRILRYMGNITDELFIRNLIDTSLEENTLMKERLLTALEIGIPTFRSVLSRSCFHGPISDAWNKVKDFFKGVGQGIKEKFSIFASWLQGVMKSGWSKTKDKASQLKEIAKTVIANGKSLTSKAATQALEFFKEHKETIGSILWKQLKSVAVAAIVGSIVG